MTFPMLFACGVLFVLVVVAGLLARRSRARWRRHFGPSAVRHSSAAMAAAGAIGAHGVAHGSTPMDASTSGPFLDDTWPRDLNPSHGTNAVPGGFDGGPIVPPAPSAFDDGAGGGSFDGGGFDGGGCGGFDGGGAAGC